MCEPVTIASLGVMAAGGALSARGQYLQAKGEENAARANQQLANLAAGDALARGIREAGQVRMGASQMIGEQQVAAGASGVDPSSAAGLAATSRAFSELDAMTLVNNAMREAWGHQVEGQQFAAEAKAASQRKWMGPAATILGTAGQMGGMAYNAWGQPQYQGGASATAGGAAAAGLAAAPLNLTQDPLGGFDKLKGYWPEPRPPSRPLPPYLRGHGVAAIGSRVRFRGGR